MRSDAHFIDSGFVASREFVEGIYRRFEHHFLTNKEMLTELPSSPEGFAAPGRTEVRSSPRNSIAVCYGIPKESKIFPNSWNDDQSIESADIQA